ncbi:MAG: Asp-tRNA(Asn)/Glu-tRNA(Gln) amidotransferase subunit GatA [Patescibacteria group bacterium]|nr:Asp-tRNA(Asn)/Glu-tRNA(Gln) amidotransferase subunit GatA [Patescibacteria group bacterium]
MIKEIHKKLQEKTETSVGLTMRYLNAIKKKDPEIHAYLNVNEKQVLKKAKETDEKIKKGERISLLEGIPCAIKDNICIQGVPATAASKILENYIAPYDATVIKKLNEQGAICLGKTNLDEFAMGSSTENSAFGITKNPHDKTRVPGGSSGGSASAVAAGMAVWALGSDTGGSIRQPASLCGVVGFKPTYGRVSRYGLIATASSYDQIGPITQTVEDAAIVADTICGDDEYDNTAVKREKEGFYDNLKPELEGVKIGVIKEFFGKGLDHGVKKIIKERISFAREQGAEIIEVELPHIQYSMAVYYLMMPSEVSSNLARFDGIRYGFSDAVDKDSTSKAILDVYLQSRAKALGDEPKRRMILGTYALSAGYYDAYYKKAQRVRELIKVEMRDVFKKVDVLLSPTSPTPAFKIGDKSDDPLEMYLTDVYTVSANVAMIPAISIPAGFIQEDKSKLPVGVQLMGKWWSEQKLFNVSKALEIS